MQHIKRRDFLKQSFIAGAGFTLLPGLDCLKNETKKSLPNLVYIFPDQFRIQALGFWAKPEFRGTLRTKNDPVYTPNLDKFASQSVVFTNAISNFPLCSPHRGMLLSGQYPHKNGLTLNCRSDRPISSLKQEITCISDVLNKEGYSQGYFGKLHTDFPTPNDPENPGHYVEDRRPAWDTYTPPEGRHGFDYWYSYGTSNQHKNPHYWDKNGKKHEPKEWSPIHEAKQVVSYIKNEKGQCKAGQPFAIMVGMNPPHSPYDSLEDCMEEDYNLYKDMSLQKLLNRPNADLTMEKTKCAPYYFASVSGVDRAFGMIINALEETGLADNTIVVFSADHGETMCSHGINDAKNNPYSECYNIPFIVRYPKKLKSGIEDIILSTPDIMPTLLGLMGLSNRIPGEVQGCDYSALLEGKSTEFTRPTSGLYIKNIDGEKDASGNTINYFPVKRGLTTGRYTLSLEIDKAGKLVSSQFFDNEKDPYQMQNILLQDEPAVIEELYKELGQWLKKIDDPWYQKRYLENLLDYS